jgi:hypothetical protein
MCRTIVLFTFMVWYCGIVTLIPPFVFTSRNYDRIRQLADIVINLYMESFRVPKPFIAMYELFTVDTMLLSMMCAAGFRHVL